MSFIASGWPLRALGRVGGQSGNFGAKLVNHAGAWAIILTAYFWANSCPALTWRWSNPTPHGNNITDMAWNGQTAVQVTDLGQIYTGLGFFGWLPRDSHTSNTLQAVRYFGNRIVFVGANGTAGYSDDGANFHVSSLNTADWLVDLAISSNLVVAVGDNAVIFASADGAKWTFQEVPPNVGQNWLLSVAWGAGMFVTTGEGGYIATSADGAHWTSRSSGVTADLTRVAWITGSNAKNVFPYSGFWAVTADGKAIYSTDLGVSWRALNTYASTNVLYAIAANSTSALLAGDLQVELGTSPTNWSSQTSAQQTPLPAPVQTYYTALWDGAGRSYWLAGDNGIMVGSTSTNNSFSWTEQYSSPRNWLWQVAPANELYVAVGDNACIMTSQNGVDWTIEAIPATNSVAGSPTNTVFFCVGGNSNLLVAAGNHGSVAVSPNTLTAVLVTNTDGTLFTNFVSSQGLAWYPQPAPTTNDLAATCSFGTNFVLVGGGGTALLSGDGTNWSKAAIPTTNYLSGLASSTNLLVATGDQGVIFTSSDGRSWTKRTSGTTNWLFRVRWVNGVFLAVGESGTILKSSNGLNWSAGISGTTNWLNDAVMVSNSCFVVGNFGTVLTSTNLMNWTNVGTITSLSLYGAATQDGQLVTVGLGGTILRSQVIPDLTPIKFVNYTQTNGQNLFVVAGQPDQQFSLDSSIDLTNWTTGPTLDLIYGSGTLLFITPAGTNEPPAENFRATLVP